MLTKIKSWCLLFSTLGPIGDLRGGAYYATLCAIPVLYLVKAISWATPGLFIFLFGLLGIFVLISLHGGLMAAPDKDRRAFVLGTAFFLITAFLGISVNIKMIVVGYLFFHLMSTALPLWLEKTFNFRIEELPKLAALCAPDLGAAILVNVMLRFILWVAH